MMLPLSNTAVKHRSRSKDPPSLRSDADSLVLTEADPSKSKRRNNPVRCLVESLMSEHMRRVLWLAALLTVFYLERQRNIRRNQKRVEPTKVISGLHIELPIDNDEAGDLLAPTEFVNVTTGSRTFRHTESCYEYRHTESRCRQYFPLVDMDVFLAENPNQPRLKEVRDLSGENKDYAVLTRRGVGTNHEQGNQDRAFVLAPYLPFPPTALASPNDFLLCLMDGHGGDGHYMSQHVVRELPELLSQGLRHFSSDEPGQPLHKIVFDAMRDVFRKIDQTAPYSPLSGTTLNVALRLGAHLHVASVGDSRTMVVAYNQKTRSSKVIFLTKPHHPDVKEEKDRILKSGGSLYLPPKRAGGAKVLPRVYAEYVDGETNETLTYTLAVSRSIGDHLVKSMGVVSDPTVATLRLTNYWQDPDLELFVASGSDGLFDTVETMAVADRVAASLYHEDTSSPIETIEGILLDASDGWEHKRILRNNRLVKYRDDITLAVARIVRQG